MVTDLLNSDSLQRHRPRHLHLPDQRPSLRLCALPNGLQRIRRRMGHSHCADRHRRHHVLLGAGRYRHASHGPVGDTLLPCRWHRQSPPCLPLPTYPLYSFPDLEYYRQLTCVIYCSRPWPSHSAFTDAATWGTRLTTQSSTVACLITTMPEMSICKDGAARRKPTRHSSSSRSPRLLLRRRSVVSLAGGKGFEAVRLSDEHAKSRFGSCI